MSYNYDINPWDDNYNPNQIYNPNQGQTGAYSSGAQNSVYATDQYQYNYQDEQQQQQPPQQYQNQDQPLADENSQGEPRRASDSQRSAIGRFLRQHVPILGSFMDTMSAINLPFIDALLQHVNRDLLVSKMFYFFFYSAFGSLFPLMGVYFKQLGMNPAQVGILTGVRPFIEIFSAPFWSGLANRFQKSKALLLFSLLSWIVFTYSLAHIHPPASACVAFNDSEFILYTPYSNDDLSYINADDVDQDGRLRPNSGSEVGEKVDSIRLDPSEGSKEILANEESQNDQRRRRRRRRSTDANSRYSYSIVEQPNEELVDQFVLDMDLESDFDDQQIAKRHQSQQADVDGYYGADEYAGPGSVGNTRSRRHLDDVFGGAGEEPAPEEEQPDEERASRKDKVKSQRAKGKAGSKAEEMDENERDEAESGRQRDGEQQPELGDNGEAGETTDSSSSGEPNNGQSSAGKKAAKTSAQQRSKEEQESSELKSPSEELQSPTGETANQSNNNNLAQTATSQQTNRRRVFKERHKTPPTHIVGKSPITVEYAINYKKEKHSQYVTPMFSTIVYKLDDIKEVFFLLLLLISLGEFFSAPALTIADSATLAYLGENTDLYGRQRMFGSLSWAITLLLVGMALDNATFIADHPCGPHQRERSYTVCFIIFSLLMACALLTATQFTFNYQAKRNKSTSGGQTDGQTLVTSASLDNSAVVTTTTTSNMDTNWSTGANNINDPYASTQPRSIFNTAPPVNAPPPNLAKQNQEQKFEFLDKWKSAVFAQRTGQLPEWVNVFRQFRNSLHLTYLFITWFLGCGVGLVFTFLFWHLQDVGGTPTLFGICSVINHISEILAYFFSFSFIKRFGHTRVLSVGLGCNVIRFLYVAFLNDPYYALPFELVQGITHAACFAACCSYISHVSKPELRTSTQGVMQGLHHGIGRACGALIGGYMINAIGSRASFCIYGLLSGCVLAGFLYIRKRVSQSEDEQDVKVDDSEALGGYGAPQGVPTAVL